MGVERNREVNWAVSRAVRLRECPLGELLLYLRIPSTSLPSIATDDRKQFQCLHVNTVLLGNKTEL